MLWKPSHTASWSSYLVFNIMREAGMPDGSSLSTACFICSCCQGVLNFIPTREGAVFGNAITASPHLAAINFTGSTRFISQPLLSF